MKLKSVSFAWTAKMILRLLRVNINIAGSVSRRSGLASKRNHSAPHAG